MEYFIKDIAEKSLGKSEFAINEDDIMDKVVYLLDISTKKFLKNLKFLLKIITNSATPLFGIQTFQMKLPLKYKTFTETIELYSKLGIDMRSLKKPEEDRLIVSYQDLHKNEEKFIIALNKGLIKDDDIIFKILLNQKLMIFYKNFLTGKKNKTSLTETEF